MMMTYSSFERCQQFVKQFLCTAISQMHVDIPSLGKVLQNEGEVTCLMSFSI